MRDDKFVFEGAGFYANMAPADYHGDPAPRPSLNQTLGKKMLSTCPAQVRFLHPHLNPNGPGSASNDAMTNGSIAHTLFLGRGRDIKVLDFKDWRTKAAQEQRAAAEAAGLLPVLAEKYQQIAEMVMAGKSQLGAIDSFAFDSEYGHAELGVFAEDPAGCWTRALIDWYGASHPDGVQCWDYKTVGHGGGGSANPDNIAWHMTQQGWTFQAAFQDRILSVLRPALAGKIRYRFFVQETEPPYLASVIEPDPASMTVANKRVAVAIGLFAQCLSSGEWPGYGSKITSVAAVGSIEAAWIGREMFDPRIASILAADPYLRTPVAAEPPTVDGLDVAPTRKRAGGRPRMTDEEKAAAKAAREAARAAPEARPPARKLDL